MKTYIVINCNSNLNLNVFWALGRLKASKAIFQTLLCLGNLGPLLAPYWLLLAPIDPRRWGQVGGPGVPWPSACTRVLCMQKSLCTREKLVDAQESGAWFMEHGPCEHHVPWYMVRLPWTTVALASRLGPWPHTRSMYKMNAPIRQ